MVLSRHLSPAITVTSVGDKLPFIGFKSSAAFLTSLSANLRLPDDELYPSPLPTPYLRTSDGIPFPSYSAMALNHDSSVDVDIVTPSFKPKNPAPSSSPPAAVPDDLPTLSTYTATTEDDRIAGLKLVADSVAQQRQDASKGVLYNPVSLALYGIFIAIVAQRLYQDSSALPVLLTTSCGVIMTSLVIVRYATVGYIRRAESVNWEWLGEDQLIVTKWGEHVIGACVLGWETTINEGSNGKKSKKRSKGGWGVVRAWTVKLMYRGKGVGEGLLEEAVEVVKAKGGDGIEFAGEHANSLRILHPFFNGAMDKSEKRAVAALNEVASTKGNFARRNSKN